MIDYPVKTALLLPLRRKEDQEVGLRSSRLEVIPISPPSKPCLNSINHE